MSRPDSQRRHRERSKKRLGPRERPRAPADLDEAVRGLIAGVEKQARENARAAPGRPERPRDQKSENAG